MEYEFIGACSCWGAQIHTCERGPQDLVQSGLFERLQDEGVAIADITLLYPSKRAQDLEISLANSLPIIHQFNLQLAHKVEESLLNDHFPIILGGDHANAVGTWNGVRKALKKPLGLIWIDAHMDAHTPETTPSGAWHGMPVAALLGHGDPHLAHLLHKEPVLLPEHLILIGIHSFEAGERALLEKLKVKIYFVDEVQTRGLQTVMKEAIAYLAQKTPFFGVSLDLDVIDPIDAPGVGSPEPGGIAGNDLLHSIPLWAHHPHLAAFELVEFNPTRDRGHHTRKWVYEILKRVCQSRE